MSKLTRLGVKAFQQLQAADVPFEKVQEIRDGICGMSDISQTYQGRINYYSKAKGVGTKNSIFLLAVVGMARINGL